MKQKIFIAWLPIAVASTIILATVYAAVQQNYRQSANDPQVQLAEDGALLLSQGIPSGQLIGSLAKTDITNSLSTFALFYSEDDRLTGTTGYLGNGTNTPVLPKGVLDAARSRADSENRVTWQLPSGQRYAAVVKHYKVGPTGGFVVVARSLRDVENRELSLETMIAIAWIITMLASLAAVWFRDYLRNKSSV